jgi:YidC/Oxa1 family membrane protein insertase
MFVLANVLQPLINVFEWILVHIYNVLGSWGWSIVGLTIVVRAGLLPLTFKQFKSMQNMQRLAPKIKELQEKYKDDKQRMNQEMMKFYQENNVNPLSSCLPLVAQFPVFISLFYMLRTDLKKDICPGVVQAGLAEGEKLQNIHCGAPAGSFLFIPDLTNKATGGVLVVLILMYVGSQVASTLLMSVTADKNQRRLFLVLPLVFVVFVIRFPAGLLVYWITTNLWTIAQQYIVRRTVGPIKPVPAAAPAGAAAASPGGGGGGGLLGGLLGGGGGGGSSGGGGLLSGLLGGGGGRGSSGGAAEENGPAGDSKDGDKAAARSSSAKSGAPGASKGAGRGKGAAADTGPPEKAKAGARGKGKAAKAEPSGKSNGKGDGAAKPASGAKPPPPPRKKRKSRSGRRR